MLRISTMLDFFKTRQTQTDDPADEFHWPDLRRAIYWKYDERRPETRSEEPLIQFHPRNDNYKKVILISSTNRFWYC